MLGLKNGFIPIIGGFRLMFKVRTSRGDHLKRVYDHLDPCCIYLPLLDIVVYVEVGVYYCLVPVVVCVILVSLLLCLCIVFCVVEVLPAIVVVVVALSVCCNRNSRQ